MPEQGARATLRSVRSSRRSPRLQEITMYTATRLNLVSGHYGGVAKQKVSTDYSQPRDCSINPTRHLT